MGGRPCGEPACCAAVLCEGNSISSMVGNIANIAQGPTWKCVGMSPPGKQKAGTQHEGRGPRGFLGPDAEQARDRKRRLAPHDHGGHHSG